MNPTIVSLIRPVAALLIFALAAPLAAQTFRVLHEFTATDPNTGANSDGASPCRCVLSENTLYGCTSQGGTSAGGTVFKVGADGTAFETLHAFPALEGSPGQILVSGSRIYGVAQLGGPNGSGTVFALNIDGTGFTGLYAFSAYDPQAPNADGAFPSFLSLSADTLCGVTQQGGSNDCGTVFAVKTNGADFSVLHAFTLSEGPDAFGLVQAGTAWYGTTLGGSSVAPSIFSVSSAGGDFATLYSFGAQFGAAVEAPSLTSSDGTLYGTLYTPFAAVFTLATDGTGFTNIYTFPGSDPSTTVPGDPIVSGNSLYGYLVQGGSSGNGTVFSLSTDGSGFTTLYEFTPTSSNGTGLAVTNADGASPSGQPAVSANVLYGATRSGGPGGSGTLFAICIEPGIQVTGFGAGIQFTAVPSSGGGPLTTQFSGPSIDTVGNPITSWSWYFGDGTTSTLEDPVHTYAATGPYGPILVATNRQGAALIGLGPIILVTNSTIRFTASPTSGPLPLTVQFNCPNADSLSNALTAWIWNFGDGANSALPNPSHTYTTPGAFHPSLVATNSGGGTVLGVGPSSIAVGQLSVLYSYASPTFGTGDINWLTPGCGLASTNFVSAMIMYSNVLAPNLQDNTSTVLYVPDLPSNWVFSDGVHQWTPANSDFYLALVDTDSAGNITGWDFDLYTKPASNVQEVSISSATPTLDGGAAVNLPLSGQQATAGVDFDLSVDTVWTQGIVPSPTSVAFDAAPTNGAAARTVSFSVPNVDSVGNAISSWCWTFGDGFTSTNQSPSHTYSTATAFYPTLIATNCFGAMVIGYGPEITLSPPTGLFAISTLAGLRGASGSTNGTGIVARFSDPTGVAVDSAGNVYVADTDNDTIRKVTATGVVTTLAGMAGSPGSTDGTGKGAQFCAPSGVAVDSSGTVYVADSGNNTIRRITAAGVVTTLAGSGANSGSLDGTGSGAAFSAPTGVAVDSAGNVYVADSGNNTIRRVTPTGAVTTMAGYAGGWGSMDGASVSARFSNPTGVAVDGSGNLYVSDQGNGTIRRVSPEGDVTTLVGSAGAWGSADGTGGAARFNDPTGVAVDSAGNIYVADEGNNTIRRVTPVGVVTTLAGLVANGGNADGTGSAALFLQPCGIAVDATGDIYVADSGNNTIRKGHLVIVNTNATIQFAATPTNGVAPLTVQFNSPAVDAMGNTITAWNWSFGDGTSSTEQNPPPHTYAIAGIFSIALVATNNAGVVVIGVGLSSIMVTNVPVYSGSVSNGGFETGDFTGWVTNGDLSNTLVVESSQSGIPPHSGSYLAALEASGGLGYLSQTLATVAGAAYRLSLWLDSPDGQGPNEFLVSWDAVTLFDVTNVAPLGWTNLQFVVSATGSSTILEFAFRDDQSYLGLDDVSVRPVQPSTAGVGLSGSNLVLNVTNGAPGARYSVLMSPDLTAPRGQWFPIATNIVSAGGDFTITLTNSVSRSIPRRFYRLQVQ